MKKLLEFLLTYKFKIQKLPQNKSGFTLIELLVGLIMGALIITPLLGFMINVMTSDRQEQAKSSSEQEIQTALDYIARDVAQSVFIYDGFGLQKISSQLPAAPSGTDSAPVLVFWKRKIMPKVLANNNDAFVMSLVAYYLIKDTNCGSSSTWSCTTRIGRVEINDGVTDPSGTPDANGKLPYLPGDSNQPSPGFNKFGFLPAGAVATNSPDAKMNSWQNSGPGINNNQIETLIDFVDQTPIAIDPAKPLCPTTGRAVPRADKPNPANSYDGLTDPYLYRQTPLYNGAVPASLQTQSFYACVNTDNTLAQVFIRGNSLARIQLKSKPPTYSTSQSAYFPKASIQVQGRGLIKEQGGS